MSSGTEHRIGAATALFAVGVADWKAGDHWSKHPLVAASFGGLCGTLPDVLEPASHPNHRQLFHSLAFAGLVTYGLYEAYRWQPEDIGQQVVRNIVLAAGVAYLAHLLLDAKTPKGLPLLGRL